MKGAQILGVTGTHHGKVELVTWVQNGRQGGYNKTGLEIRIDFLIGKGDRVDPCTGLK